MPVPIAVYINEPSHRCQLLNCGRVGAGHCFHDLHHLIDLTKRAIYVDGWVNQLIERQLGRSEIERIVRRLENRANSPDIAGQVVALDRIARSRRQSSRN